MRVQHGHCPLQQTGQRVVVGRQPHEVWCAGGVEHEAEVLEAADGSVVPRVLDARVGGGVPPTDRLGLVRGRVVGDDELEARASFDRGRTRSRGRWSPPVERRHTDRDADAIGHGRQAGRAAATRRRRTVDAAASAATAASPAVATSQASRTGGGEPFGHGESHRPRPPARRPAPAAAVARTSAPARRAARAGACAPSRSSACRG